mgnify:FL=1
MDRKETTEFLRNLLIKEKLTGMGKYWASEVSFNPWTTKAKRVDFVQFIPEGQCHLSEIEKGIFVCYEVKSCKQDIYSGNGLNFYGEKNYIVTTMECYKEIEPDIKDGKLWKHINNCNLESFPFFSIYKNTIDLFF